MEAMMIEQIFQKDFSRYVSLPVLGSLMDRYAGWLQEQQYTRRSTQYELRMTARVCKFVKCQGIERIENVREQDLESCYTMFRQKFPTEAGAVRTLTRFLTECDLVRPADPPSPSYSNFHLNGFMSHLYDRRGYAHSTVRRQVQIAGEFLEWLDFESNPEKLSSLGQEDVEGFIRHLGKRMGRVALQKPIATLRNFLRFMASSGCIPPGLESRIDTPRVYRQEQLPCALPWITVQAFIRSIDRTTAAGIRDYAMFSLMATYGLRSCDIVALKLEDIEWRADRMRICQSKTGNPLELPLTPEVGSALYRYLKKVPRYGNYRQVFLRLRAPAGPLKPTAVTEAFQAWSRRSGLDIPFKGPKCLRHSYAIHLLRHGLPLKTIGDLLGHRSVESTAVYLRLATEDLRDVALHVPVSTVEREEGCP
jgi:site-specific recombinase XerD